MRRHALLAAVAASLFAAPCPAQIPTPSAHLGLEIGADRTLADYRQIRDYFDALDAASPRVAVETIGETTGGEPMILAAISSEANLANLDRIREIAARLADPRGLSGAEVDALVEEGRAVMLVICAIHADEIGSTQMAMEWAHALATTDDPEVLGRLDEAVVLLVPSANPDGQIMEVEWYRRWLGTEYEGVRLPRLYHRYVGHDLNRDWFMLTQAETRALNRVMYRDWFPQVVIDEHQMGSDGPRMFVPPFANPVDPDVHPLVFREIDGIGTAMSLRLEQAGKAGVIYGYAFDAYWIGGTRNTPWWKNVTGVLTEIASVDLATPIDVDPSELEGRRKGLAEYGPRVNFPNPWEGGAWRLRDVLDYGRIASDAALEWVADHREDVLRDMAVRARAATEAATPDEAYVIPADQRDPAAARRLAELMAEHGVEVRRAPDGDVWIPLEQPYARFVREMMEPQRYPEVRPAPGADPYRPYDVSAWTLPLLMGVRVEKTTMPEASGMGALERVAPRANPSDALPAGDRVPADEGTAAASPDRRPDARVATYQPWRPSMDEGWTRWVLESRGYEPVALHADEIADGRLGDFDALVLADIDPEVLQDGERERDEGDMRYRRRMPPDYRGGLGDEGADAVERFVEEGGTLVALDSAADWVIERFEIPVRNTLADVGSSEFSSPGSILRALVEPGHPVTASLPDTVAIFLDDATAFETTSPGPEMERTVLVRYPADERDILLSGWIRGAERLERRAGAVALTRGEGRIVLIGFRPQFRGQTVATFPLLFDAVEWGAGEQD